MKHDNFWMVTLVALLVLGIVLRWPLSLRVAVIANSLLVLFQVAAKTWRCYHAG
jgi:uncharacterized membrane protein